MFKIRCSQIGQIMTNDRSGKGMGQTAKTYCDTWIKQKIYGRIKEITSKYMDKGIQNEEEAIQMVSERYGLGWLEKNEIHFTNSHMTGTPDIINGDIIRDIKCSWDCFSFPLMETDLNKDYYWQLQGYMELTGINESYVDYVLTNTPDEIITRQIGYEAGGYGITIEREQEIWDFHTYNTIPIQYRIKSFRVDRNDDDIQSIYNRVDQCRNYIESVMSTLNMTFEQGQQETTTTATNTGE